MVIGRMVVVTIITLTILTILIITSISTVTTNRTHLQWANPLCHLHPHHNHSNRHLLYYQKQKISRLPII